MSDPAPRDFALMVISALGDDALDELAARLAPRLLTGATGATEAGSPWLTVDEAAGYLRMPKQSLYKLTSAAAIPHRKPGNRLLFHRGELDEWMEQHREGPPPRPSSPLLSSVRQINGKPATLAGGR